MDTNKLSSVIEKIESVSRKKLSEKTDALEEAVLLEKVETVDKLKALDYDFLLKDYSPEDVLGLYYPTEEKENVVVTGKRREVDAAAIFHGRLFIERVLAWESTDGNLYVSQEEFEEKFT